MLPFHPYNRPERVCQKHLKKMTHKQSNKKPKNMKVHFYVIHTLLFVMGVLIAIQLSATYQLKRGPQIDHELLRQLFQTSAQASITADELMKTNHAAGLEHALEITIQSLSKIETIQLLLSTQQLEEVLKIYDVRGITELLRNQITQIKSQLKRLLPAVHVEPKVHRHVAHSRAPA